MAGKVALVTGGSRGIGAAIVKRLAADGAAVALTYSASSAKADEVVCAESCRSVARLLNLDALRECGAKDRTGGSFRRRFAKEFHAAIAMTEPDFVGACREKQRLFFPQLAPDVAW